MVKNPPENVGDSHLIPVLGRSRGEGNGNPLQYSCMENPMDKAAWWATVCGVVKSRTQLTTYELNWPDVRHIISRSYELNFVSPQISMLKPSM